MKINIKNSTLSLSITIVLFFNTVTAFANEKADSSRVYKIDEVVLTGSKVAVKRNMIPLSVSVISRENIENSSETALLPVLGELVPGLFVTERGVSGFGVSNGSAGQISMRGVGSSPSTQVLILLNGNPQFMGIMGHPLPDAYVASDVERVEIIRGPGSALYGTNAMGGVINIITKKQKSNGFSLNARGIYGSYNTQKYMVNSGFKKNKFNIFASYNHDQTDGHRDSSDFKVDNGYLSLGYDINNNLSLSTDFSLANFVASDPGPEFSRAGNRIDITRGMGSAALTNNYGKTDGSVRFFYNFGEHDITDGFHSNDINSGIIAYQSFRLFNGNNLSLGIDYKEYGGKAENKKAMNGAGIVFSDTTITEVAGYFNFQQILFNKLILNAGLRLEHNSNYGIENIPTAGIAYLLDETTSFKSSVSKGFRSPTIRELYLWGQANQDLRPERMVNYEIGFSKLLLNKSLSLEVTGFYSKGSNLIQLVAGQNGMKFQNSGEFSNTGLEVQANYNPFKNFSLNANYSFIDMDEPLLATPEHKLFIGSTYKIDKFTLNASLQFVDDLYTQINPSILKSTYALVNAKCQYRLNKNLDLFIKGENLTDTEYYINYQYPMPGLVILGGFNLSLFN